MKKFLLCFLLVAARGAAADPVPPDIPLPQMRSVELPALPIEKVPTDLAMKKLRDPVPKLAPVQRPKAKEVNGLLDLLGGEENLRIALAPDRIEVSRLTAEKDSSGAMSHVVEEQPMVLSDRDAKVIREIVTSDGSYNWEQDQADCVPVYNVRLKFWHGQECLRVDVAFGCAMVRVGKGDAEVASKNVDFGVKSLAGILDHYVPGVISRVMTPVTETAGPSTN